ncbi:Do family serine endopeptidase [Sinorhizobium meliloti]|jgi:serine protease Do|nr:Do family serine endopeptidase [Sinorhizobium meliloti]PST28322.1 PDZ domain-containing protein [Mesorhizobium loti]TWB02618.1 serine protease Do [Ensifer sp. SEMIA 134]TWB36694.1 serine protease Do [Ensifer sp. SEMIA 135]AEG03579.1 protease Do [Sinorhizobium meliloti BL225C]AEG52493.1 protease Do [Sinorhizobium meliloti AK83]
MSTIKAPRPSLKTVLKTTTVAGLAAVLLTTGLPAEVAQSFAEAVRVQAPAVPSFANVVDAVSPAVVSVRVQARERVSDDESNFTFDFGGRGFEDLPEDHPLRRFFREFAPRENDRADRWRDRRGPRGEGRLRPRAQGSGFFITEDGYLVTNNHVVSDGSAFTVIMNDGTELDAKLVGKDSRTDLAVLKVDDKRKFTYVSFADDEKVRVGDWVVAVGNPFGLGGTVTAGIISARGRDIGSGPYDDYLQVDAAVNRGNSGGPTFNLSGEVVGINTAIFSPSGGNVGIAFAIPASVAKDVVDSLIKDGTVSRGWLGVQIQPVTKDIAESLGLSEANGALVVEPQAGSPGEKAGIKNGDVVTALNGEPVKDPRDLARRVAALRPGSTAEVTLWRSGKSETVNLEIGTLPSDAKEPAPATGEAQPDEGQAGEEALADLGLTVTPSEDGKGVTIASVDPDSDAGDRGLKEGEKIVSVNNQEVKSADDVLKVINNAKKDGRSKALFQIEAQEGSRFVALPITQG